MIAHATHRPKWADLAVAAAITWSLCPAVAQRIDASGDVIHRGFTLTTVQCHSRDRACIQSVPKPWSETETAKVKAALDEIASSSLGGDISAAVQRAGVRTVARSEAGVRGGVRVPAVMAAFRRTPADATIQLYDRLFLLIDHRDQFSGKPGYSYGASVMLHEMLHVIDRHSTTPEFAEAAGFVRAGSGWRFSVSTPQEVAALGRWEKELIRLEAKHDYVSQHVLNRELALGWRPVRIPTLDSVRSPAEAFAEVGSHLVLDPHAGDYLPSRLVHYFNSYVFPQIRRER